MHSHTFGRRPLLLAAAAMVWLSRQDELIAKLIRQRRAAFLVANPDPQLGQSVFEKQCAICHQLGGEAEFRHLVEYLLSQTEQPEEEPGYSRRSSVVGGQQAVDAGQKSPGSQAPA